MNITSHSLPNQQKAPIKLWVLSRSTVIDLNYQSWNLQSKDVYSVDGTCKNEDIASQRTTAAAAAVTTVDADRFFSGEFSKQRAVLGFGSCCWQDKLHLSLLISSVDKKLETLY